MEWALTLVLQRIALELGRLLLARNNSRGLFLQFSGSSFIFAPLCFLNAWLPQRFKCCLGHSPVVLSYWFQGGVLLSRNYCAKCAIGVLHPALCRELVSRDYPLYQVLVNRHYAWYQYLWKWNHSWALAGLKVGLCNCPAPPIPFPVGADYCLITLIAKGSLSCVLGGVLSSSTANQTHPLLDTVQIPRHTIVDHDSASNFIFSAVIIFWRGGEECVQSSPSGWMGNL